MAAGIDRLGWPNITAYDNYQLNIEDALEVAEHDIVWFVDAAKAGPSPYDVRDLSPAPTIEFTSHIVRPEAILAIAQPVLRKDATGLPARHTRLSVRVCRSNSRRAPPTIFASP